MTRFLALAALGLLAACQTPGYDYAARAAPHYPEALDYTDVVAGRFDGPAGEVAEDAFDALIQSAELEGRPWFNVSASGRPQGMYEGSVGVTSYRAEIRRERERKCVEYDAPFDCERRAIVERECVRDIVEIEVRATLVDLATDRRIFTAANGGTAEQDDCRDIAEYPDTGQPLGTFGSTLYETYSTYDAPYGMIREAVSAAVRAFRQDIAPYITNVRAEIVTQPLVGEERGDARFAAAVEATQKGNFLTACNQWTVLADEYPAAPGIQHNAGACAEARGDFAAAQTLYAKAAEIVQKTPVLNDKDAKVIFESLGRISRGRHVETLIGKAVDDGAPEPVRLNPEKR